MTDKSKKWLKFALRWTIAAAGISFVLWKIEFHDRVTVLHEGRPVSVRVFGDAKETDEWFTIEGPTPNGGSGEVATEKRQRMELWVDPDVRKSRLLIDPQTGQPSANGPKYRIL